MGKKPNSTTSNQIRRVQPGAHRTCRTDSELVLTSPPPPFSDHHCDFFAFFACQENGYRMAYC